MGDVELKPESDEERSQNMADVWPMGDLLSMYETSILLTERGMVPGIPVGIPVGVAKAAILIKWHRAVMAAGGAPMAQEVLRSGIRADAEPKRVKCSFCEGKGAVWNVTTSNAIDCVACNGSGTLTPEQAAMLVEAAAESELSPEPELSCCPWCDGMGTIWNADTSDADECIVCYGSGKLTAEMIALHGGGS